MLPVVHRTGVPVDVVLAGPGIEELFFERAVQRTIAKRVIPIASAKDLGTMKILAGRPKDLEDVFGIVRANPGLDDTVIRETLGLLEQALDQRDLLPVFERMWALRSR